jgi:predicted DNA-binding protein (MmcQ/YjbR family)
MLAGMSPEDLRSLCLSMPGASEEFPFAPGVSVFKVEGKMFALSRLDEEPLQVSVKCEPALAEQLRLTFPAIRPGYHLNKRHWNTITLDGSIEDRLVRDMVEDSWDLVLDKLPAAKREALRPSAEARRAGGGAR